MSLKAALARKPLELDVPDNVMGALVVAGRKRRGFKESELAYGEMTSRWPVNSAVLPPRAHVFLRCCADVPRRELGNDL